MDVSASISTLVTSHYAEGPIQKDCRNLGVKILPKMMAANIAVTLKRQQEVNSGDYYESTHQDVLFLGGLCVTCLTAVYAPG